MEARLTKLEELLMHLQQTVVDLDGVVLDQQKRIEHLERELKRFNLELGLLRESHVEQRSLEDEKPPHY